MMKNKQYEIVSADEMFSLGETIGKAATTGEIYALIGDLGAGKTVFSKGFAAGLGITETVVSPTFMIVQEYDGGRLPLYHFDVYRIEEPDEMAEIGFDEYIRGDGVCLIEWADRIAPLLPDDAAMIRIARDLEKGADFRRVSMGNFDGKF